MLLVEVVTLWWVEAGVDEGNDVTLGDDVYGEDDVNLVEEDIGGCIVVCV